jgi:hypothetical protein
MLHGLKFAFTDDWVIAPSDPESLEKFLTARSTLQELGGTCVPLDAEPDMVVHKRYLYEEDGEILTVHEDVLHVHEDFVEFLKIYERGVLSSFTLCPHFLAVRYDDMRWVDSILPRTYIRALEEEVVKKKKCLKL